jgi:hypothetical protein
MNAIDYTTILDQYQHNSTKARKVIKNLLQENGYSLRQIAFIDAIVVAYYDMKKKEEESGLISKRKYLSWYNAQKRV